MSGIRETITPETVANIMRKANPDYARGHERNLKIPAVAACQLGAVFVNQAGDYCVYTGIGYSRKRPVTYTRIADRQTFNAPPSVLRNIARGAA
jgi:hypothetical protein